MSLEVSLDESLEEFARTKVSRGEYGSVSEVVREGLRLLQREDIWKKGIEVKIEEGVADCRAGRTVPDDQAWLELKAWSDEQQKVSGSARSILDLKPISVGEVLKAGFDREEVWDEMMARKE